MQISPVKSEEDLILDRGLHKQTLVQYSQAKSYWCYEYDWDRVVYIMNLYVGLANEIII